MPDQTKIPNHIARMAKTIVHINRMALLKEHGFTEQKHIGRYKKKLADNPTAQTLRNAKTLAANARNFRLFVDRCVGLA